MLRIAEEKGGSEGTVRGDLPHRPATPRAARGQCGSNGPLGPRPGGSAMLTIGPIGTIYSPVAPQDGRKGIDGLAGVVRAVLGRDRPRTPRLHAVVDLRPRDRPADRRLPGLLTEGPRPANCQAPFPPGSGAEVGRRGRAARPGHRVEIRRSSAARPLRGDLRPARLAGKEARSSARVHLGGGGRENSSVSIRSCRKSLLSSP